MRHTIILLKFFGIKDARRWVLEHFGHNKQQLYEPGFLTVTFEFQRKSHLSYGSLFRLRKMYMHITDLRKMLIQAP